MKNINILLNLILIFFSITTLDLKPATRSSETETKEAIERIDSDMLIKAINEENKELAIKLIKSKQINLNFKNNMGATALSKACARGFTEIVKLLLEHGADIDVEDEIGSTPLMAAIWNDKFETSKLLLEYGANINSQTNSGWTILIYASYNGNYKYTKLLLEHDADINIVNNDGLTALDIARTNHRHIDVTNLIKDRQVINQYNEKIFKAYEEHDIESCKSYLNELNNNLLAKKKFLLLKNKEKNSLLHKAVIKRDYTLIDYILNYNPEIVSDLLNMPNKNGMTPIDLAATDESLLKYFMNFAYPPTSEQNSGCIVS